MEGLPAVSPIARSRVKEATVAPSGTDIWFVVLASLPDNRLESARKVAADKGALAARLKIPGTITTYKTKISRNYAIVIGGPKRGEDAEVLARAARDAGLADGAFPQQNKEWALVE